MNNLSVIGTANLKNKWIDLLERSRLGLLVKASCERHDDEGHAAAHQVDQTTTNHHQQQMAHKFYY